MLHSPNNIPKPTETIAWNNSLAAWTVWRYDAIVSILKNKHFSAATANIEHQSENLPDIDHDPVTERQHVMSSIQKNGNYVEQKILEITRFTCSRFQEKTTLDLQKDIIIPCCHLLALELSGVIEKGHKSVQLIEAAQKIFLMNEAGNRKVGEAAMTELVSYFLKLLQHRHLNKEEDIISAFTEGNIAHPVLLSPVIQLFVGLSTSLPLLLGNILFALISHPKQQHFYQNNAKPSVSELLRYAGPVQVVYRIALQDCNIEKQSFKRGDRIALLLHHGNFDQLQFDKAASLNLNREAVAHLSFGKGIHACLGTPIIRQMVEIIPQIIFEYFPKLNIDSAQVSWGGSSSIQGITQLPVEVKT